MMSAMETGEGAKEHLQLVLVGLQGVGKSAAGNIILGREEFPSEISSSALTLQTKSSKGLVCERRVMVVDTPGLFNSTLSDTELKQEMEKAMILCHPGPHVILITIQLGCFTEQERSVMDKLVELLGSNINLYSMVLFTYGDKLKSKTVHQFVKEDKNLMKLIGKCGGQYYVFNNADTENKAQVREFLEKIETMIRRRKIEPFYVKSEKHVQYPRAKNLCITLPVVELIAFWMYTKKRPLSVENVIPAESLSQPSVEEVIPAESLSQPSVEKVIPVYPEDELGTNARFWQMLHGANFSWKVLIPTMGIGLGTGLWILRKLWK